MGETNYSNSGLRRAIPREPHWGRRLGVFASGLALLVLLYIWMQQSVDLQLERLQRDFGDLSAESFFVGVRMRASFRSLNEQLLDYHLTQAATNRESLLKAANEMQQWLQNTKSRLRTAREIELLLQTQDAYASYLLATRALVDPADAAGNPAAFRKAYQTIHQASQPLFDLTEQFVKAQQAEFNRFLDDSQEALSSLRRYRTLMLALLLALSLALSAAVYGRLIAPLRKQVSESWDIIQRQEKLASLGTLAAGIAHEIRNPLTAIKFRLFSLKKSLPPDLGENEDLGVIGNELNRLDRIVREFLEFGRPSDPQVVRAPAELILREVHDLLQLQLEKSAIELRLEAPGTTWIHADTQQLKQVLVNLVRNAADSIQRNGQITLRVRQASTDLGGRVQPVAILQVVDTGAGIPPEVQKRLFDPFFSTKEGGTGLGLPIAARIAEKHGGLLRFETELNRGTTFELVLPRIEDHAT